MTPTQCNFTRQFPALFSHGLSVTPRSDLTDSDTNPPSLDYIISQLIGTTFRKVEPFMFLDSQVRSNAFTQI